MIPSISSPIITHDEIQNLQHQADKISLSPLIRSYISSILIALRLHPRVVSTSISARAVGDIRNLVKVMALRDEREGFTNAENIPEAVERCISFRVRTEGEEGRYEEVLKEILETVRAPF
jgi:MoxR-like ATPase